MDADLEKQHEMLKAQSQRFAAKISPVIMAAGLLQEAMGLVQAQANHAEALKAQLENEAPDKNG